MTLTIYGIPNCDTMKKAFDWLNREGIAYTFHDYKRLGIDAAKLKAWSSVAGWQTILNSASTTFKALPEAQKQDLTEEAAIGLMVAQPSMIKRPVFDVGGKVFVGFKVDAQDGVKAALEQSL